ncbi:MAG: protease complex subunit PrcB family protein [Gammaproteobacteria bacterium]|nr:protease complex subunit PrcB family protein [Gammaproteobacteria bacterium]
MASNIRFTASIACALLLLPLVAACQSKAHHLQQQDKQPAVEALYTSQQCGRSQSTPSITWINNAQQLATSIQRIQSTPLGGKPPTLPKLDFQHEIVLLIEMGQRPTLGYQITLTEINNLHITSGQAHLTVDWIQPPADAMVAQMISSPCLLLKLKRGDYTSVQILDRQGTIKAGS